METPCRDHKALAARAGVGIARRMEWRDQGALIAVRRHGESAAIIEVFTEGRGRHAGVVRGGAGRRMTPILQPGAQLDLTWRARLDEHIGHFTVEPLRNRAPGMFADRRALLALGSVCALLQFTLPERESCAPLYRRTVGLLDALERGGDRWLGDYLHWEMGLLDAAGFGLDLSRCAVTGMREGLSYVSPRSGCAVSATGAGDWADRLLPLPPCLLGAGPAPPAEVLEGLRTTGHFLHRRLAPALGDRPLPSARARLIDALVRDQAG